MSDENMEILACPIDFDKNIIPTRLPNWTIWLAFFIGLSGAISLRLILIAKAYKPEMIRLLWYIAVCCNMAFFLFRTYITNRRRRLIISLNLMEKLNKEESLCPQDFAALRYLIASIYLSKEIYNYLIIFLFSLIAIFVDIFMF